MLYIYIGTSLHIVSFFYYLELNDSLLIRQSSELTEYETRAFACSDHDISPQHSIQHNNIVDDTSIQVHLPWDIAPMTSL